MKTQMSKEHTNVVAVQPVTAFYEDDAFSAPPRSETIREKTGIDRIDLIARNGPAPATSSPRDSKGTRTLQPFWTQKLVPVDDPLYFYLRATEDYRADGRVVVSGHGEMLMLGSYSYLGLNRHPKINKATHDAIEKYGTGGGGARLLSGPLAGC
jgi:hypothetical protein